MGRQKGPLKVTGTLGDITFAQTKNGFTARDKSFVAKEKRETDPAFAKFRAQKAEFGRAATAVHLLRSAFELQIKYGKDTTLTQRLQRLMVKVIKSDSTSERGERTPENGNLGLLEGFKFNDNADWSRSITVNYKAVVDRVNGKFSVSVDGFTPKQVVTPPDGSNHFRIVCACSEVDFVEGSQSTVAVLSDLLPIDNNLVNPLVLSSGITANSTKELFLVLGIQFAEVVNGFEYPDSGGQFNALAIVTVDQA